MQKEKIKPYVKWTTYYLILIVLYALQTTPRLFEIYAVKPILIAPFVICICMFEGVMPSAIFAMFGGLLWDLSSDKVLGFNAIIFVVCGVLISLLCIYYLHTKLMNSVGFCAAVLLIQGLLEYFFYYAIWGYQDSYVVLISNTMPCIVYTTAIGIPIFFLVRFISNKYNIVTRV